MSGTKMISPRARALAPRAWGPVRGPQGCRASGPRRPSVCLFLFWVDDHFRCKRLDARSCFKRAPERPACWPPPENVAFPRTRNNAEKSVLCQPIPIRMCRRHVLLGTPRLAALGLIFVLRFELSAERTLSQLTANRPRAPRSNPGTCRLHSRLPCTLCLP